MAFRDTRQRGGQTAQRKHSMNTNSLLCLGCVVAGGLGSDQHIQIYADFHICRDSKSCGFVFFILKRQVCLYCIRFISENIAFNKVYCLLWNGFDIRGRWGFWSLKYEANITTRTKWNKPHSDGETWTLNLRNSFLHCCHWSTHYAVEETWRIDFSSHSFTVLSYSFSRAVYSELVRWLSECDIIWWHWESL